MEIRRTYWITIEGKTYPDESSMVAKLLDENMLFVNGREYICTDGTKQEETLVLFLNCNDSFVPAADAESLTLDELPKLFSLYEKKGDWAVVEFVAHKRGYQPMKHIKELMIEKGVWTEELEKLTPSKI